MTDTNASERGRTSRIEHIVLLGFMALASSILVRDGGDSSQAILQCLIWLAAGDSLYLFLRRRRKPRARLRTGSVSARKRAADCAGPGRKVERLETELAESGAFATIPQGLG